jgi:phosphoenolpyruvate carboxylase
MTAVIRIFYLYSSLLNVADEAHSHRRRREEVWASRNARPLWPASFDHTLRLFKEANVGAEDLQALLNRIEVKSKNNSLAKIMCQSPGQASFTRSL